MDIWTLAKDNDVKRLRVKLSAYPVSAWCGWRSCVAVAENSRREADKPHICTSWTPLMYAAANGAVDAVLLLLEAGVKVRASTRCGSGRFMSFATVCWRGQCT